MQTKNDAQHIFWIFVICSFSADESFINNGNVNFYNDVFTPDTQYLAPNKFQRNFKPVSKQSLSSPSYI